MKIIKRNDDLIINTDSNNSFRAYLIGISSNYVLNYIKGDLLQLGKHENTVLANSGCRF